MSSYLLTCLLTPRPLTPCPQSPPLNLANNSHIVDDVGAIKINRHSLTTVNGATHHSFLMAFHIIFTTLYDSITFAAAAIIARAELLIVCHYSLGATLRTPCPSKMLNDHWVLDVLLSWRNLSALHAVRYCPSLRSTSSIISSSAWSAPAKVTDCW